MAVIGETEAQATPSGLMGRSVPAAVAIFDANAEVYRYVSVRLKCPQADLTFCPSTLFRSTPLKQTECKACFQDSSDRTYIVLSRFIKPCSRGRRLRSGWTGHSEACSEARTVSDPDYHQDKRQHSFTWRLLGRPTHMRRPCKGFSPSPYGDEQADLDHADTKGKQRLWVRTLASGYPF